MSNTHQLRRIIGYRFTPYITINGVKRWARNYGRKAWRIPIYAD